MEQSGIKKASHNVWKDVFNKVKHSIVFMDNQCAECLFWIGGPMHLYEAGAIAIKDFSSFECGSANQKKAVFVVSSLLQGKTLTILQDIITASKFDYCVVFTTVDCEVHKVAFSLNSQNRFTLFEECEEKMCEWMGNMNYTSEVFFAPIFLAPYTPHLFVTPSLNNFFSLLGHDLFALDSMRKAKGEKHPLQRLSDLHFYALPISYQTEIKQLVSYLNELFEMVSCKEELFAMGTTSRLIATQLANLPAARQRRKVAATTASLILFDRSLDPVAISRHSDSSLADKILGILPALPGHYNNVSVDMVKLTTAKKLLNEDINKEDVSAIRDVVVCPGCLCPSDEACPQLLQDMILFPQKEAMSFIKRSLMEASLEEGITLPGEDGDKSSFEEIFQLVENFHGNAGAIMYHNNLLQLSMAAAQTLSDSYHQKWMDLSAVEKLLILDEDPISKIIGLTNEYDEEENKQWSVEDLLGLLVFICSLKDLSGLSDEVWDDLSNALSLTISDCSPEELPEGLCDVLGLDDSGSNNADLDDVQDLVEQILEKLKGLSKMREQLNHFRDLSVTSLGPPAYKPALVQLLEKIFDNSRPVIQPDLENVSTGLMDFLKSGFSMFKKTSQPRPNDAKVMFIFIVGGVSFDEVADINKIVNKYNSCRDNPIQVIVGSTRIASPNDAVDKFLFANNLSPTIKA